MTTIFSISCFGIAVGAALGLDFLLGFFAST